MNKFTCARCEDTFLNRTPEYLKMAEAERNFGKVPSNRVSICEDCYQWFISEYNKLSPEEKEEIERESNK